MKLITATTTAIIASATFASAGGMIEDLCGTGHLNEAQNQSDIQANPDGYFIRHLGVQISHGDPRIVNAVGKEFHLCTRSSATPEMDTSMAYLMSSERDVKYLFVPACPKKPRPGV